MSGMSPSRVTLEVGVSMTSGNILVRVLERASDGAEEVERYWASGVQELLIDLGRDTVLVLRPGREPERRPRE